MNADDRDLLVEAATSAHRDRDVFGELRFHPAFHDLDVVGREALFDATAVQRALEASANRDGLSSTARAVLQRIRGRG